MNTPGVHDGIIRAWVNGVMAFEKQDIMYRTVDSLKIEQIWMNVYHGGTVVSPYDQHLYFDNVVIAREYIGPIPGTVPILQEEKACPPSFSFEFTACSGCRAIRDRFHDH